MPNTRGKTVFKVASRRKIDLKIVCQGQDIELSHSECARFTTTLKAIKDQSKCFQTNQCILNEFLNQDISDAEVENSIILGLQFAGNYRKILVISTL